MDKHYNLSYSDLITYDEIINLDLDDFKSKIDQISTSKGLFVNAIDYYKFFSVMNSYVLYRNDDTPVSVASYYAGTGTQFGYHISSELTVKDLIKNYALFLLRIALDKCTYYVGYFQTTRTGGPTVPLDKVFNVSPSRSMVNYFLHELTKTNYQIPYQTISEPSLNIQMIESLIDFDSNENFKALGVSDDTKAIDFFNKSTFTEDQLDKFFATMYDILDAATKLFTSQQVLNKLKELFPEVDEKYLSQDLYSSLCMIRVIKLKSFLNELSSNRIVDRTDEILKAISDSEQELIEKLAHKDALSQIDNKISNYSNSVVNYFNEEKQLLTNVDNYLQQQFNDINLKDCKLMIDEELNGIKQSVDRIIELNDHTKNDKYINTGLSFVSSLVGSYVGSKADNSNPKRDK